MSANGQAIGVTRSNGESYELTATWPAPYFVIYDTGEGEPLLYHAESLADAQASSFAKHGGYILDSQFVPVSSAPKGWQS